MMVLSGITFLLFSNLLSSVRPDYIDPADCKIIFYYGPSFTDSVSYPLSSAERVTTHPKFVHSKTVWFIPDYYEPQLKEYFTHHVIDALLKANNSNTLYIDWGAPLVSDEKQVKEPFLPALFQLSSDWLAKMNKRIKWGGLHVLAYAKGVEFISNVVHDLFRTTQLRIPRITQLAPPQELIVDGQQVNEDKDLITEFIDAIHTDIGDKGANVSRAHADFFPNGGTAPQPGCPKKGLCSRRRSFLYYAESVNSLHAFCGYNAPSYEVFESMNEKNPRDRAYMGKACPTRAKGNYFLDTNADTPYGRGC